MKSRGAIAELLLKDSATIAGALIDGTLRLRDGRTLETCGLSDLQIEQLAQDIITFIISRKLIAPYIAALSQMKWLDSVQAIIYSHKSMNKLKELVAKGRIYGTKGEDSGEWIFDRASIDAYYNTDRVRDQEYAKSLGGN